MGGPNSLDTMDRIECSAVYIDHRVSAERWVYQNTSEGTTTVTGSTLTLPDEPESLQADLELLLDVCKRIYLCNAAQSLSSKLAEINENAISSCAPVFAFFDIDINRDDSGLTRRKSSRGSWPEVAPPSPSSLRRGFTFSSQSEGTYDLKLLSGLSADIQVQESPNLIIPVAILRSPPTTPTSIPIGPQSPSIATPHALQISKCLDAGAVDVLTSPLDRARIQGLIVHAFRARKSCLKEQSRFMSRKKLRKHSWVGVHDEQPYAYLREAMVSKLMKGICNPEEVVEEFQDRELDILPERREYIREQIGYWSFTAHEFSEDELVLGACEMLQHAFTMPDVENWQLTPGELRTFLLACRASYNSFVLYHNFRHAIDVLQSVFCFLVHIGALPSYGTVPHSIETKSPLAAILTPFDTLTLLISAIGHDVGHPGVNNFFLVKLNAPLAQLYNDNSVLEAFHCAAFSQILRRYWPATFKDRQLRKLLISSILATDMGVHQKFMERLGSLQEKFHENDRTLDGWKPQDVDMYKTLVCGLLIKCADISNVARPWDVAEKWTKILQEEFANQGEMEKEVGMETALFGGPPEIGNIYKLATGQIGFMSIFALPLFEGVADIIPDMRFTVEQIRNNQFKWHTLAEAEKKKMLFLDDSGPEDVISPRTRSPADSLHGRKGFRQPVRSVASDSSAKRSIPTQEALSQGKNDYFGSIRSSVDSSSSHRSYNENTISPVVSPDTPGPSMDITGDSHPSETPSRKSSSAVPDLAMLSLGVSPHRHRSRSRSSHARSNGSIDHQPRDPSVLASVIYANAEENEKDNEKESEDLPSRTNAVPDAPVEDVGERPSSSRNGLPGYRRHHANTGSSGRTSGPSNSQRNSCTRTHSVSTYSNNMTPISPATNATSYNGDSGDEKGFSRDSVGRSDLEESDHQAPSLSPSADEGHHPVSQESTQSAVGQSLSPGVGTSNGSSGAPSTTTTSGSLKNEDRGHSVDGSEPPSRRLPKRRSRIRLAFWKRKTHHSPTHELSGES